MRNSGFIVVLSGWVGNFEEIARSGSAITDVVVFGFAEDMVTP